MKGLRLWDPGRTFAGHGGAYVGGWIMRHPGFFTAAGLILFNRGGDGWGAAVRSDLDFAKLKIVEALSNQPSKLWPLRPLAKLRLGFNLRSGAADRDVATP